MAGSLLGLLTGPSWTTSLKRGVLHLRGPAGRIDRRHQPVAYWTSILVTAAVLLTGLGMIAVGVIRILDFD